MTTWLVLRSAIIGRLEERTRVLALARARAKYGHDITIQSVAEYWAAVRERQAVDRRPPVAPGDRDDT